VLTELFAVKRFVCCQERWLVLTELVGVNRVGWC